MQSANLNLPVIITGRHVSITDAMRLHAEKKLQSVHLDYPRIMEARVILDVESGIRHRAEIVLYCANHITIEASSVTEDMYASIDETVSKVARRMRKFKTRMLKSHRPRKRGREEAKLLAGLVTEVTETEAPRVPEADALTEKGEVLLIHRGPVKVKSLSEDEAIEDLEVNERSYVVFLNQETNRLSILHRKEDGDYAIVEPDYPGSNPD